MTTKQSIGKTLDKTQAKIESTVKKFLLFILFIAVFYFPMRHLQKTLGVLPVQAMEQDGLTFSPDIPNLDIVFPTEKEAKDYKVQRLQEMASLWKGTILEKHTVPFLSMLLQEDGTLTAERRHDCHNGVCFAIGFMGHNIQSRGTPIVSQLAGKPFKLFRSWKGGKSPQQQFEEEYPKFSTEWRIQFAEYTLRMTQCIDAGKRENQCIQDWNSKEKNRIAHVATHEEFVRLALAE